MSRSIALLFVLCFATTGLAQSGFNGKWVTDRPTDPLAADAQRKQRVELEVTIEDAKASATLATGGLGGTFYALKDGRLSGNRAQFRVNNSSDAWISEFTWTIQLVDENTVTISRSAPEARMGGTFVQGPIPVAPTQPPARAVQAADVGGSASIAGIVQDPSAARIPGVTVTATNLDNGTQVATVTDEAGRYVFAGTMPGNYTVTAALSGFNTATAGKLTIGDRPLLQDFTLTVRIRASEHPSLASCSQNGLVWCSVLHRAK